MAFSRKYMDEIWGLAQDNLPGWVYAVLRKSLEQPKQQVEKEVKINPAGPSKPAIGFVSTTPSVADLIKKETLTGVVGDIFKEHYLDPLGLSRDHVWINNLVPDDSKDPSVWSEWFNKSLEDSAPKILVALGQPAKDILGDRADFVLPHPQVFEKKGKTNELNRKLKQILDRIGKNWLDGCTVEDLYLTIDKGDSFGLSHKPEITEHFNLAEYISKNESDKAYIVWQDGIKYETSTGKPVNQLQVSIKKASKPKQIVYGVVLDPYGTSGPQVDAHDDWTPPSEIEASAHQYLKSSMVIGMQHQTVQDDARVVESWIEQYPTSDDYQKAMNNEDHRVTRRSFGDDVIHSGSWAIGVQLGDKAWEQFEKGKINAFSPGGVGIKTQAEKSVFPKVNFVDLIEAK